MLASHMKYSLSTNSGIYYIVDSFEHSHCEQKLTAKQKTVIVDYGIKPMLIFFKTLFLYIFWTCFYKGDLYLSLQQTVLMLYFVSTDNLNLDSSLIMNSSDLPLLSR